MILEPQDKVTSLTLSCGYRSAFLSVALSPLTWPLTFWILLYLILDKQIAPLKWAILFCICLKNLNWLSHEVSIKLELLIVVIKLTQGGTQVSLCMGAATTYTYSQVSNVSVEQIKKLAILLLWIISSLFLELSGWLYSVFVFFFACFYSFLRKHSPPTAYKSYFFFLSIMVLWEFIFFPFFHFFQHGKINKRYITSVNANKEQEPKKV